MSQTQTYSGARMVLLILGAAALSLAWGLASVRTAHAEINGACDATLNAVDVRGVDSGNRDNDIKVSQHDRVPIVMTAAKGFRSHKIQLEFADQRWTVSNKTDDGSTTFSDSVNVDNYATYGVGLYKVIGVATLSDGTVCTGAATVNVSGNPLATVAGLVAAGAVVAGTVGAAATGALSGGRFGGVADAAQESFATDDRSGAGQSDPNFRYRYSYPSYGPFGMFGCLWALPFMLLMLPFMAVAGGGGTDAPQPTPPARKLPRMRWMPRITLLGLVSGLFAGLGVAVLLQQYAIEYPTLAAIIRDAVAGAIVYGLVVPTLGNTVAIRRVNGKIAAFERSRTAS